MRLCRSSSGPCLLLLFTLVVAPQARAVSNYVAEVTQPFLSIARDEAPLHAAAGAVSPIGAWSAQAEIDADLGSARATTVGCEYEVGFQKVCNNIAARGDSSDYIRLIPSESFPIGTPVEIVFYWFLSGSVHGIGAWGGGGSMTLVGNSVFFPLGSVGEGYSTGGVSVVADHASYSSAKTFTATLLVGQTYWLTTSVNASSAVRTCPSGSGSCDLPLGIDVDFSNGAVIGAWPRGGGYASLQLVGDSGRDYLVPLPEPAMTGTMGSIVIAMASVAGRRRRARP